MFDTEKLTQAMGRDAFAELAGMEVVDAGPGYAEVIMPVVPAILNGHGKVHGGALFTLADYAAAVASNLHGEATMATNGSISFLRAVAGGQVVAKARTVKSGRRMKYQMVELFDDAGDLVVLFQGGSIVVKWNPAEQKPPR